MKRIHVFFFSNKGQVLFELQIIIHCKNRVGSFKSTFLKNHWVRKAQVYMKTPGIVQIENYLNRGPRADGATIRKTILHKLILEKKIFFLKTSRPISIKLDANYCSMKAIQVCSTKM
jgi:hypothetical protein